MRLWSLEFPTIPTRKAPHNPHLPNTTIHLRPLPPPSPSPSSPLPSSSTTLPFPILGPSLGGRCFTSFLPLFSLLSSLSFYFSLSFPSFLLFPFPFPSPFSFRPSLTLFSFFLFSLSIFFFSLKP
ncbi:hypothetical protein DSO57_1016999 [Entomophthora muscae]|uniref:Uncharacterized protein n=1 Tax=Entomophthora muscae TaxID=34485 RepID=A0ACC2RJH1_9FUNG|nr:hypothetical protein DSO57_1016999 [Entomophthora muscae]